jgi:hypothetical protein
LESFLEVLRACYNFIRQHSSLQFGEVTRTPAMQAGLTKRALTFRDIMSWLGLGTHPKSTGRVEFASATSGGGGVMAQHLAQHAPAAVIFSSVDTVHNYRYGN